MGPFECIALDTIPTRTHGTKNKNWEIRYLREVIDHFNLTRAKSLQSRSTMAVTINPIPRTATIQSKVFLFNPSFPLPFGRTILTPPQRANEKYRAIHLRKDPPCTLDQKQNKKKLNEMNGWKVERKLTREPRIKKNPPIQMIGNWIKLFEIGEIGNGFSFSILSETWKKIYQLQAR